MSKSIEIPCADFAAAVPRIPDTLGADTVPAGQNAVLVKPNLVNTSPFPLTTPVALTRAVVGYIRTCSGAEVVVAEGCGDACRDTSEVFAALGYTSLSRELDLPLLDLNHEACFWRATTPGIWTAVRPNSWGWTGGPSPTRVGAWQGAPRVLPHIPMLW